MKIGRISENPVLVGGDYKRACLFFDEVLPVMWPSGESEDETRADIAKYGEYRDALEAPFLKDHLLRSAWRGWVEGYAHLANARFVFLKMRRDHPEATNIWQLAGRTLDFLKNEMPGVDQGYVSIFFPDVDTLAARVVVDPLDQTIVALEQTKGSVDVYGHQGRENTDDSVDVMLSNIDLVQCDNLTWKQISEIKDDREAISDLRKLRRWMLSEMKGYTKSHVEDLLSQAVEDHKNAAKKWGIATLPSSISVDCEASIVTGILTAVGAMATGVLLPMATAIGTIAPLAQALISINRGRKSLVRDSKVRYLVRLEREANKAL